MNAEEYEKAKVECWNKFAELFDVDPDNEDVKLAFYSGILDAEIILCLQRINKGRDKYLELLDNAKTALKGFIGKLKSMVDGEE